MARLFTPKAVLSFPHLAEPQQPKNGKGRIAYTASLLFMKGTNIDNLWEAAIKAAVDKWGAGAEKRLKAGGLRSPFRTDWEDKGYPEGTVWINVKSTEQPTLAYIWPDTSRPLVNGKHPPMLVPQARIKKDFYPGVIVIANVGPYAYDQEGNKGVSFGLNTMQKISDGPRLDGRKSAEEDYVADENATPQFDVVDAVEASEEDDS